MKNLAGDRDSHELPDGKSCRDCRNFDRCQWLLQVVGDETECDWSPSRFSGQGAVDELIDLDRECEVNALDALIVLSLRPDIDPEEVSP